MPNYRVTWSIDITADTPQHAAMDARITQRQRDDKHPVYLVEDTGSRKQYEVNLAVGATYQRGTAQQRPPSPELTRMQRDLPGSD